MSKTKPAHRDLAVALSKGERAGLQRLLTSLAVHQDAAEALTLLIQKRANHLAEAHGIDLLAEEAAGWSWQLDPEQRAFHRVRLAPADPHHTSAPEPESR